MTICFYCISINTLNDIIFMSNKINWCCQSCFCNELFMSYIFIIPIFIYDFNFFWIISVHLSGQLRRSLGACNGVGLSKQDVHACFGGKLRHAQWFDSFLGSLIAVHAWSVINLHLLSGAGSHFCSGWSAFFGTFS